VPSEANKVSAAIGFRVKSGWAAAVLVGGSVQSPEVLDRRVVELSDPAVPESRQPYHAGMGRHETDESKIDQRRKVIARAANQSVADLINGYRHAGHRIRAVALVVGSEADPAKITNPHIRAHALEGQLFRTVLQDALRSYGLTCSVILERNIYLRAANILKQSEPELKSAVTQLGRKLQGPWRSDDKAACLAAWLALVEDVTRMPKIKDVLP
jgi:hypothetical protein